MTTHHRASHAKACHCKGRHTPDHHEPRATPSTICNNTGNNKQPKQQSTDNLNSRHAESAAAAPPVVVHHCPVVEPSGSGQVFEGFLSAPRTCTHMLLYAWHDEVKRGDRDNQQHSVGAAALRTLQAPTARSSSKLVGTHACSSSRPCPYKTTLPQCPHTRHRAAGGRLPTTAAALSINDNSNSNTC